MTEVGSAAETREDFGSGVEGQLSYFLAEINAYEREVSAWHKRGEKINKRYMDERPESNQDPRFNVLWSNIETMRPAIYAATPKPEVTRRFGDRHPAARVASMVLERALTVSLDEYDFDAMLEQVLTDRLLPGRGQAWVRYQVDDEGYGEEHVYCDYLHWKDFGHTTARVWSEVEGVWRRVFMTRDQLVKRFGEEIGKAVPLDHKPPHLHDDDATGPENEVWAKATVYEFWHKPSSKVLWIAKSYDKGPLDTKDDPLGLRNFFPCPRPMYATKTTDNLVPQPDFKIYQDQADEIDDLTGRIHKLQDALRVVGIYDASKEGVQRMLNDGVDNTLIPIEDWNVFADGGGIRGYTDFLPLDQVINALNACYQARDRVMQELYEMTGLSDIIRGASDARETAKAQGIKAQWGSLRVRDKQRDMQRFARDVIRIKAEIIAEHFSPKTLAVMSNVQGITNDETVFIEAIKLLRDDKLRGFIIDIETDSTIEPDEQAEKQSRNEFLQVFFESLRQAMQIVSGAPEMAPMMKDALLFSVRGFRAGRQLEEAIEESMDNAIKAANQRQQQPPPPDPKVVETQGKLKLSAQETAQEGTLKKQEMDQNAKLEVRQQDIDAKLKMREQDLNAMTRGGRHNETVPH